MSAFSEGWVGSQSILVILAHPDDPEFFLGATIARWTHAGHRVSYCLLTRGDKGANDPTVDPAELSIRREKEQRAAAAHLGVQDICFLDFSDGCLQPSMEARRTVTRVIREAVSPRAAVEYACDPSRAFGVELRAGGQVVLWTLDDYLNEMEQTVNEVLATQTAARSGERPEEESEGT